MERIDIISKLTQIESMVDITALERQAISEAKELIETQTICGHLIGFEGLRFRIREKDGLYPIEVLVKDKGEYAWVNVPRVTSVNIEIVGRGFPNLTIKCCDIP